MSYAYELAVAVHAAQEAGQQLALRFHGGGIQATHKQGDAREPVTSADLEADQLICGRLAEAFPEDLLLTEETDTRQPDEQRAALADVRRWVIDPLDGTSNFIAGVPFWAVSIALEDQGECVLGVVYDPVRDEIYQSARGRPATCNLSEIQVGQESLSTAMAAVLLRAEHRARPEVRHLCDEVRAVREFGATALELAWVAAGRLDLCLYRRGDRPWDWLAGERLILDAGGELAPFNSSIPGATLAGCRPLVDQASAVAGKPS